MRLLASLHHYLATSTDDTLTVHQYATAAVAGAGLDVEVETDYPWDGLVTLRVTGAPARGTGDGPARPRVERHRGPRGERPDESPNGCRFRPIATSASAVPGGRATRCACAWT